MEFKFLAHKDAPLTFLKILRINFDKWQAYIIIYLYMRHCKYDNGIGRRRRKRWILIPLLRALSESDTNILEPESV